MKTRVLITLGFFGALTLGAAPTIPNPSFEANSFADYPGYIADNSPIVGWTTTDPNRAGLNPASHSGINLNPFADNGVIPDGANVAFIQSLGGNSSLSTVISDLTIGETYNVNFRVNARSNNTPNLKVSMNGANVINSAITHVGGSNPYKYFAFDFTAAALTQTLTLSNDASGDHTVLLDDFSIAVRNSGWSYAAWNDDASSGVVATNNYTHAYNFGSTTGTTINGIYFTGVAGANPSVAGSFFTAGLPAVYNNDANNVTGASRQLANDFLWGGAVQSITINGLTVGKSYVATIYSVAFEDGPRAATFSVGDDRLTVNQDQFGDNNGIRVSYRYTATSSSMTLTYVPLSGSTFHTYGFANYELGARQIVNPSFEANSFTVWPGYISGNTNIVGWTTTDPAHAGLNPASGSPFADNGTVPHGNNVAFIQSGTNSSLSTVISNLTVGQTYKVNFRVNARSFGGTANLKVDIAGTNVINTTVAAVQEAGLSNPYQYFAFDFTAAAPTQTLTLRNDAGGDHTVLVDNFSIGVRNSGWSYAAWTSDASSGVVATNTYTHAYHFGSSNATTINGITFTGIAAGNNSASSFSTDGLPGTGNNDTNNLTTGGGGSAVLAHDFFYGWTPSLTINGLLVGNSYVATIYSVGDGTNGAGAATFSVGDDRLTANQNQFGDNNGIRVSYSYTATARSMTLTYVSLSGSPFHTYGFSNYELANSNFHAAFLVVTNLADSGPGTLRQAIADAAPGETITFAINGKVRLSSGPLFITNSMNIVGPGPAQLRVDGNLAYRVFMLEPGLTASISGLTIQNGRWPNGGGLGNFGTMVLSNCVITGNAATASSGFGGAIHNGTSGVLSLISCSVSNNSTGNGGTGATGADGTFSSPSGEAGGTGGPGGYGGGIYNEGVLALTACTVNNNKTGNGGPGGTGGNGVHIAYVKSGDGGRGGSGGNGGAGGGVYNGSAATLALTNCTIYGNSAGNGGSLGYGGENHTTNCGWGRLHAQPGESGSGGGGGAIYNVGRLVLSACTVGNNAAGNGDKGANGTDDDTVCDDGACPIAPGTPGGPGGNGGGIYNDGVLTLMACTVNNNKAGNGAPGGRGANSTLGPLHGTDGGNGAPGGLGGNGGGIYNERVLILTACTVNDNTAGNGGPGGWGGDGHWGVSCHLAEPVGGWGGSGGNGGAGGGVYNGPVTLALTNSTIYGNSTGNGGLPGYGGYNANSGNAPSGGGGSGGEAGGIYSAGGLVLNNAIVAGNPNADIVSLSSISGANDLIGGDPLLAPLGNYGGPTQTMPPLHGSPAIDAGSDSVTNFLATDQRGFPRRSGTHVDIGAVEAQVAAANNPPLLTNPAKQVNGTLTFSFANIPNADFTVLTSTNVALPLSQWSILGWVTQGSPGQYQFGDPVATNYPQRFYQVVSP